MREIVSPKRLRTEAAERKRVLRLTRAASARLGNDFFQSLVKHVASAVGADCVYVGAIIDGPPNRIGTLAVWLNGEWAENFEQGLPGAAAAHVLAESNFACSADAAQLFPEDPVLERMQAQAFVGCRLSSSAGQVLGVLAAVYTRQLTDLDLAKSVLEAFTPRAAAELERRCDHERLRRADERHRAFIASSMDAMWRIEFEKPIPVSLDEEEQIERMYRYGYLAECNETFARLSNAPSVEDVIGSRFEAIVPRSDMQLCEELRSVVRSGYRTTVVETTPLDALGRRMYRLRTQFGILENGELQRIWGTTRDITELKRAELALDASERRCREMLERLQLPAVLVGPAGQILFANDALLRLGGWSKQQLTAGCWFDVLAGQESREGWNAALVYAGAGTTFARLEGPVLCAGGTERLVSWDTTLLLDADGRVEGIAAIGTDITSKKVIESQIRQAQKLEGIARLAAGVAHDFNNLLTVVLAHTSCLLGEAGESPTIHERVLAIQASAMQCAGLTEQLLAVARKQRLQPVIVSLNSIIRQAEAVLRSLVGPDIVLDLQLDPCLRLVNADPAQIERVLANLSANARDAMPDGGKLVVSTANVEPDGTLSEPAGLKPGQYVQLTVADTGIGMSDDVQARIFDPFFTTKPAGRGVGLGLSTVYGIVAQSGGHISVRSRLGKGTCFEILMPAAEAPENPRPDQVNTQSQGCL